MALANGTFFSKIDLAHAYQQIPLDEESKDLTTINTEKGLFRYNRLPFGISAAPAIFQRTMEGILHGLPGVFVYIDDILVTGRTKAEHLKNLDAVLKRLEEAGFKLKKGKCAFMMRSIEYLGYIISADGVKPNPKKLEAVIAAPTPTDVSQLRSFIGLMNYYGKFIPNLASVLSPLYRLLQKNVVWRWGKQQRDAFEQAKESLVSGTVLQHYDPDKDLVVSCDASPYGIGAVLAHREEDGTERPISYASRSLAAAEKRYSQLDKEGLAIVFAVKKFHNFLYGRQFTIYSDHKPLQYIFGATQPVPALASARIQRWALLLSAYNYKIQYKSGKEISHADGLSRLPLPDFPTKVPIPGETIMVLDRIEMSPVNASKIKLWTQRDPILSQLHQFLLEGWPAECKEEHVPYQRRKEELTLQNGCILWGNRVIIPPAGRESIMELLHNGHPGVSRMKSIARSFVWWPNMDKQLEEKVKKCGTCQMMQNATPPTPIHPWEWPKKPWSRIHVDYAGPFMNKMFLIVVDAHSKWMEVAIVSAATTAATTEKLRGMFATHGLPEILVSDNGAVFTSKEFQEFLTRNGIHHVRSAPYHASFVEWAGRTSGANF